MQVFSQFLNLVNFQRPKSKIRIYIYIYIYIYIIIYIYIYIYILFLKSRLIFRCTLRIYVVLMYM